MGYTVALTGGIGSGKSTVADAFAQLGVKVIDADVIARQVVEPGTPALQAIVGHFGPQMIAPDGTLNRRLLREKFLLTWRKSLAQCAVAPADSAGNAPPDAGRHLPYLLWVVPLLVENRLSGQADRVLVVDVPKETQIERTMLRDKVSREHAEHILAAQATRQQRLAVADDVIENTGTPDAVASDVARLHEKYLTLASQAASQENS
ncbi:dephospho-CoA kinase [Klebsiella pneumoniae]